MKYFVCIMIALMLMLAMLSGCSNNMTGGDTGSQNPTTASSQIADDSAADDVSTSDDDDITSVSDTDDDSDDVDTDDDTDDTDYSSYLGWWNVDYGNSAGAGVNFISFDGDTVTFEINTCSTNAAHIAQTNQITAQVEGNTIQFTYRDSWENDGTGTITLNGDSIHVVANPDATPTSGYAVICDTDMTKV